MSYVDFYNVHAKALSEQALAQDRDDYYFAISGVDVGRYRKHIHNSDIDPATGEKKVDKVAEAIMRTLDDWLRDENYRKNHEILISVLDTGLTKADNVLDQIHDRMAKVEVIRQDMLDRAPRLPDGRRIFRFEDGTVKDEDGQIVDDDFVAHIQWPDNAPTGEDYFGFMVTHPLKSLG